MDRWGRASRRVPPELIAIRYDGEGKCADKSDLVHCCYPVWTTSAEAMQWRCTLGLTTHFLFQSLSPGVAPVLRYRTVGRQRDAGTRA
jgi:hypothetical protein